MKAQIATLSGRRFQWDNLKRGGGPLLGWFTLVTGMWLVLPFDTFSRTAAYSNFFRLGVPEWLWGGWLALLGAGELVALGYCLTLMRRRLAALFAATFLVAAVMVSLANFESTATPSFMVLAGWSVLRYYRLRSGIED